jgi:flagellar hook protein FlgE
MTTYYVKTDANTWDVYAAADNKEIVSASVAAAVNSDSRDAAYRLQRRGTRPPDAALIAPRPAYALPRITPC